jgi:hypothetical protein
LGNRVTESNELVDLLVEVGESGVEKVTDVHAGGLTAVADLEDPRIWASVSPAALPRWMKSILVTASGE